MRILIKKSGSLPFFLFLPTKLMLNRLSSGIVSKALQSSCKFEQLHFSAEDLNRVCLEILRMKKKYPGLELVNVQGKNGDIVKIRL